MNTMMYHRGKALGTSSVISLIALAFVFTGPAYAANNDNHARVLRQERLILYLGGERAGNLLSEDRMFADGSYELFRESHLSLRRGSMTVNINSKMLTRLNADLSPISFDYQQDDGNGTVRTSGEVKGSRIIVYSDAGGARTSRTIDLAPGVSFGTALELRSRRDLRVGQKFSGQVLFEELGALVEASYTVEAHSDGFLIRSHISGIDNLEIVDKNGRTKRIEIPALGGFAVPETENPPPVSTPMDVLARTTWAAPSDLPHHQKLLALIFRIDGTLPAEVPGDRRQRVLKNGKSSVVVRVEKNPKGPVETLTSEERLQALAETPYEPVQDPRIQAAAKAAIKGTRNDVDKIKALTRFVYRTVDSKDLSRAYAPATETLETGVGDCTEHSVLFSALAKAVGIPTRLVDGVVVADGRIGYHEWVEVYLDNEGWRPVDPTFGEPYAGPNRLKLAVGDSRPESLLRMGLTAAAALTGLKISIIAHEAS